MVMFDEDDCGGGREALVYDARTERRVPKQQYVRGLEDELGKARHPWEQMSIVKSYLRFAARDGSCDYSMLGEAIMIAESSSELDERERKEIIEIANKVKEKFGL
jgi:tellurite resistance protein